MGVRPREINVHIGELVLHGIAPTDALGVGQATERELTRLLTEGGVADALMRGSTIERIDAGSFACQSQPVPDQLGTELAGTIYRGMSR